ncbi:MAG TPA: amidase family protein, partial [Micropepsaceae bacterium]|nr:amidase family protein [Micropepsaceae bacterium]
GIGSDTGGSTRMPASFCGVVGYKPSKFRIPTEGAFPLSYTLDSIGPLAKTVAQCAAADAVLSGENPWALEPAPLAGLRIGVAQGLPLRDLDDTVSLRFSSAREALNRAGARLSDETIPYWEDVGRVQAKGSFSSVESFAIHRAWIDTRGDDYDPNVRVRIEAGRNVSAADYIAMQRERARLVRAMAERLADLDALIMPTTAIVAPTLAEVASVPAFQAKNVIILRNAAFVNFFDLCAISLPMPREGGLPCGLMLVAKNGDDHHLFRMVAAVEKLFA